MSRLVYADPGRTRRAVVAAVREVREKGTPLVAVKAAGTSLRGIARTLDRRGLPTPRGGAWSALQVSRVLDSAMARDGDPN